MPDADGSIHYSHDDDVNTSIRLIHEMLWPCFAVGRLRWVETVASARARLRREMDKVRYRRWEDDGACIA